MSTGHPAPHRHNVPLVVLVFCLAAAPLAWLAQTSLNYLVASRACYPFDARKLQVVIDGLWPVLTVATLVALAIGIIAAMVSWRAWRATREEHPGGGHEAIEVAEGRTRFLALSGMMLSVLFVAAVLFNAVGLFVVPPCG
jgi:hypothetical protein